MGTVMASGEETATKKRDQLFSFDTVSTVSEEIVS
jgi:hypothetical protein